MPFLCVLQAEAPDASEDDWGSLNKDNQYQTWIRTNTMSREAGEKHGDTINIDEKPPVRHFLSPLHVV